MKMNVNTAVQCSRFDIQMVNSSRLSCSKQKCNVEKYKCVEDKVL